MDRDHRNRGDPDRRRLRQRIDAELTQLERERDALDAHAIDTHLRRALARTLHDELQQLIVGTRFQLRAIREQLRHGQDAAEALGRAERMLDRAEEATRRLATELRPSGTAQGGLQTALAALVGELELRHGLRVVSTVEIGDGALVDAVGAELYHAARTLLLAAARTAGGGGELHLSLHRRDAWLTLRVASSHDWDAGDLGGLRVALGRLGGTLLQTSNDPAGSRSVTLHVPAEPGRARRRTAPPTAAGSQQRPLPGPHGDAAARDDGGGDGPLRLLLVDDHPMTREGLTALLEGEPDMTIAGEAERGERGVELARELQPDVIVMDVSMPGIGGIEATRRLVSDDRVDAPVIALSMHEDEEVRDRMLDAGASAYLLKSGPLDDLVAAVRAAGRAGPTAPPPVDLPDGGDGS